MALASSMVILCGMIFAAKAEPVLTEEELDFAQIALGIDRVQPPYLKGDYVIFTQEYDSRFVGIAFDFEKFNTIHPFQSRKMHDADGNETGAVYFFVLRLPKSVQEFNYRIVVDGLWTTDPLNKSKTFSREANLTLSHFDASRFIPPVTEKQQEGYVRFIYRGKSGQRIRLGGSFTNWDSWIYQLKEVSPGLYQLDLPLPPGTYEYAYFVGTTSFIDESNPQRCYTAEGKKASRLVVN